MKRNDEDLRVNYEWAHANDFKDIPHAYAETTEKGHGRIEVRKVWCTEDITWSMSARNDAGHAGGGTRAQWRDLSDW